MSGKEQERQVNVSSYCLCLWSGYIQTQRAFTFHLGSLSKWHQLWKSLTSVSSLTLCHPCTVKIILQKHDIYSEFEEESLISSLSLILSKYNKCCPHCAFKFMKSMHCDLRQGQVNDYLADALNMGESCALTGWDLDVFFFLSPLRLCLIVCLNSSFCTTFASTKKKLSRDLDRWLFLQSETVD